jgi:rare lipoprotein A
MWTGRASWYESGHVTANGERFRADGISCASRVLSFGTLVEITNMSNGRRVVCRVNDRGPYVKGRDIDLSLGAAKRLGFVRDGLAKVLIRIVKH